MDKAELSPGWIFTEGATIAKDFARREDWAVRIFRGRGVRGLAVEESESWTVTQLITLAL